MIANQLEKIFKKNYPNILVALNNNMILLKVLNTKKYSNLIYILLMGFGMSLLMTLIIELKDY